jgi:non-canonical purine NTP pyrophosphatase (RdgB/HAM1 family)
MKQIFFLTENINKFKELKCYLDASTDFKDHISLTIIKPDYELHEIQSMDRNEIVRYKLSTAIKNNESLFGFSKHQNESNTSNSNDSWIMVEDTSFCIDKLGGFPGPFIKYYLQSLPLQSISNSNWGSNAQSYVNLAIGKYSQQREIISKEFEGVIPGVIVEPRGNNGFGFDAIFQPYGYNITNAEMTMTEKSKSNPRIIAFYKVLQFIDANT